MNIHVHITYTQHTHKEDNLFKHISLCESFQFIVPELYLKKKYLRLRGSTKKQCFHSYTVILLQNLIKMAIRLFIFPFFRIPILMLRQDNKFVLCTVR